MATTSSDAPVDVAVRQRPLSAEQQAWLEAAWAQVDEDRIRQLDLELTRIPSPTGHEREVSERLAEVMGDIGLDAHYQAVDAHSGNAIIDTCTRTRAEVEG